MKRVDYNGNKDYGVSEVIGFILILGLMVTGIGLITLYGYPILLKEQASANVRNMEKNLIVLQTDVNSLSFRSVPYKETSMQVNGGSLRVVTPGISYFTIHRSGGGPSGTDIIFPLPGPLPTTFYPGLLQYKSDSSNAMIGLQNGAVVTNGFSETGGGSTMLSMPRWYVDDIGATRTVVITMIQITSSTALSENGIGTVQMMGTLYPTQIIGPLNDETITITYFDGGEGYSTAWHNYFMNSQVFPSGSLVSGSTLTIYNVDKLVIKSYQINILNL